MAIEPPSPNKPAETAPLLGASSGASQAVADEAGNLIQIVGRFSGPGEPIVEGNFQSWLLEDGRRMAKDAEFFDALCRRLLGAGLPIWRASLSVGTLHPQILGLNFRWWRDRRMTEVRSVGYGVDQTNDYRESPIRPVMELGRTVRYRLDDTAAIAAYPLLGTLRAAGATDYFACPLTFFNGRHQATTWTTDRPGGFTESHIAGIASILPILGSVVEARAMRRLAGTLLNTYLGRTAGQRILEGEIRRAQGEEINAVILVSDMRGFTNLSDRLPGGEIITLLDDYFDAVTAPVEEQGGEVLKFMGDGLLAIFPYEDGAPSDAADNALTAATSGLARIERLNQERRSEGRTLFHAGIGLHLGEVIYGNVGSAERLDFTVIGPAVNLASRLEDLTKRLLRPMLFSSAFARVCPRPLVSLGFHPVRGLLEPEEVFGLPE
ncbi:MAG: adenylate/guanylate cyclase domain-containing protein [Alphaproteobacteria bacterium]|nr:adenylate/guanylate cyclase domain-containing protein [Alphaproteobacteria bacterium]